MTRKTILIIFLTLSVNTFGQTNKDKAKNIYALAVTRLVDTITLSHNYLIKNDTLVIWCDNYILSGLPTKIHGITILYLDNEKTRFYKNNEDGIYLIYMSPIIPLTNNELGIDFDIRRKFISDDVISIGSSGGIGVLTIIFDCKLEKYLIKDFQFSSRQNYQGDK